MVTKGGGLLHHHVGVVASYRVIEVKEVIDQYTEGPPIEDDVVKRPHDLYDVDLFNDDQQSEEGILSQVEPPLQLGGLHLIGRGAPYRQDCDLDGPVTQHNMFGKTLAGHIDRRPKDLVFLA